MYMDKKQEHNYYGYIYITTNNINNKKYIGQHKSDKFDYSYKGSGKIIIQAFNKYGKENFKVELLEWCNSKNSLNQKEKYWIEYYKATTDNNFYNISKGGEGHSCQAWNKGLNKEIDNRIKNISEKMKIQAKTNENLQKIYHNKSSNKQKEAVRLSRLGKKDSIETLTKKKQKRGKYNYSESSRQLKREKITGKNNPNFGGRTEESKKKEAESMSNRVHIHKLINNKNVNKLIKKDQLENYLKNNWELGWIYNKKSW